MAISVEYLNSIEKIRKLNKGSRILYIRKDSSDDLSRSFSVLGCFLKLMPEMAHRDYGQHCGELLCFTKAITIPEIIDIPAKNFEEVIGLLKKFEGLPFDKEPLLHYIDPYPPKGIDQRAIYLIRNR